MDKVVLALVVGLLSGTAGGLAVHHFAGQPSETSDELGGRDSAEARAVETLWARIEKRLDEREAKRPLTLQGSPQSELTAPAAGGTRTLTDGDIAALLAGMETTIAPAVKEAVKEAAAEGAVASSPPARPSRKRMSLAKAAEELELSAGEEDALREVYAGMADKALKILAGPDGDVEEVRRDLEAAKKDPAKRGQLMTKYIPKVLPRVGEFMVLEQERREGVQNALGEEKAAKLESGYTLEEQDPFGFGRGFGGGGFRGRR